MNWQKYFSLLLASWLLAAAALAQETFPNRPLQMLVPFPPAAPWTSWAANSRKNCKTSWANRWWSLTVPAPTGVVAWQSMATTKPDGHTLFLPRARGWVSFI